MKIWINDTHDFYLTYEEKKKSCAVVNNLLFASFHFVFFCNSVVDNKKFSLTLKALYTLKFFIYETFYHIVLILFSINQLLLKKKLVKMIYSKKKNKYSFLHKNRNHFSLIISIYIHIYFLKL
jgi:hypothetical protein